MQPFFMPIKLKRSQKCSRCNLRYPRHAEHCSHCYGLSDRQVESLKEQHQQSLEANANLGKWFVAISVVLAVVVMISIWGGR